MEPIESHAPLAQRGGGRGPAPSSAAEPLSLPPLVPPPEAADDFDPRRNDRPPLLKRLAAPFVALIALLAKFKFVLLLLPKIKLLATFGTALVSIAAYSLWFGWPLAVGFVVLLFLHEMGHVIQLRREGIAASAPMFIPFLGAVVAAKSLGRNALAEARVGLAGPVLGTTAALVPLLVYAINGDPFWRVLAYLGFFINLFNLLPVVPLDGGRAMAAMSPALWFVGFAGLVAIAFVFPNPIMLIILLFGALETWRRWKARRAGGAEQEAYYRVRPAYRALVAGVYVGLIVVLALGLDATYIPRTL